MAVIQTLLHLGLGDPQNSGHRLLQSDTISGKLNGIYLGTCDYAAENGGFGGCFRQPFHQSLTRAPGRFNPFLGFSRQAFQGLEPQAGLPTFSPIFSYYPPSLTFSEGPILVPQTRFPKWASLRSAGPGSQYIWTVFPTSPSFLPPSSSSRHHSPSSASLFVLPL